MTSRYIQGDEHSTGVRLGVISIDRVYHEDMLFTVIDYTLKVVITKCDDGAIFQTMHFPTSLISSHTAAGSREK
jgi:hypothetical protein